MSNLKHRFFVAAALASAIYFAGSQNGLLAQDKMADDHMKAPDDHKPMAGDPMMADNHKTMSEDQMKMVGEHLDKMKAMAADPASAEQMTKDMAKMMTMDHMAMQMAADPKFKEMCTQCMSDANLNKVHDDAMKMANDPAQMAKIKDEIMADPKAMKAIIHMATTMAMQDNHMMHDDHMMRDDKMKDMAADKK